MSKKQYRFSEKFWNKYCEGFKRYLKGYFHVDRSWIERRQKLHIFKEMKKEY